MTNLDSPPRGRAFETLREKVDRAPSIDIDFLDQLDREKDFRGRSIKRLSNAINGWLDDGEMELLEETYFLLVTKFPDLLHKIESAEGLMVAAIKNGQAGLARALYQMPQAVDSPVRRHFDEWLVRKVGDIQNDWTPVTEYRLLVNCGELAEMVMDMFGLDPH